MMSRKDYISTAEILASVQDKTHPAVYGYLAREFAVMFGKDNANFDVTRFYDAINYNTKVGK
jgi:hypothetical protein